MTHLKHFQFTRINLPFLANSAINMNKFIFILHKMLNIVSDEKRQQ